MTSPFGLVALLLVALRAEPRWVRLDRSSSGRSQPVERPGKDARAGAEKKAPLFTRDGMHLLRALHPEVFFLFNEKTRRSGLILCGWGWRITRASCPRPYGLSRCARHARLLPTIAANLLELLTLLPQHSKKPAQGGLVAVLAGDGGFEPPLTESESVVLPLDESPNAWSHQQRQLHGIFNVWSTADACALCAGQPSCAQPRVRHESGSRHDAWGCADPHRIRRVHVRYRDEWHQPDRWYRHL